MTLVPPLLSSNRQLKIGSVGSRGVFSCATCGGIIMRGFRFQGSGQRVVCQEGGFFFLGGWQAAGSTYRLMVNMVFSSVDESKVKRSTSPHQLDPPWTAGSTCFMLLVSRKHPSRDDHTVLHCPPPPSLPSFPLASLHFQVPRGRNGCTPEFEHCRWRHSCLR